MTPSNHQSPAHAPTRPAFVQLQNGPVLPLEPVLLALALESRGFTLQADGTDLIVVPGSRLTPDDCDAIRRWKSHLLAIVSYVPPDRPQ